MPALAASRLLSSLLFLQPPSDPTFDPNEVAPARRGATQTFCPTNYTVVDGFFAQSSSRFNDSTPYDPLDDSFGLLDKSEERWERFAERIDRLNRQADVGTAYKVLFVGRHGEGWHNVGERKYGTKAWDSYWSMLEGDGEIKWGPDPLLTPLGERQAARVNSAWKRELGDGAPLPQSFYSSPLSRAASTLEITWSDILEERHYHKKPLIREHLRETMGVHTCDKRNTKTYIKRHYPSFRLEVPFSEHDELWSPDWRESDQQHALRTQQVLNKIFATDSAQFVSITAHGGVIQSFLRAVNHRKVSVSTGSLIPVVVKAVDSPRARNELLAGGQSIAAPARPHPTSYRTVDL